MPFSRYLQSNERDNSTADDDLDHQTFSTHVNFQLPNLILNAPAIPPGGGAEALPAGLFPPSSSLPWFSTQDHHSSPFPPPNYPPFSYPSNPTSSIALSSPPAPPISPYALLHNPHSFPTPNIPLNIPSALGLPVYSSSGFDLISLLARVVNRPYPKIYLGPVDLSCSFTVTDTRRFDSPIVYASPSFLRLTGYDEHEVIGRNCRFLQAPGGLIQRGQDRHHTSREAVAHMRKNIIADKECQVSIVNYRKDGAAFINMVSVIPIRGGVNNAPEEADDIVYHIGFQVDLTEQPKSILTKLKDGTYVVNYSDKPFASSSPPPRDWRSSSLSMRGMSKHLRALLADSAFAASFQLSTSTHASTAIALSNNPPEPVTLDLYDGNKPLHMFMLDRSPDFIHVVSLKGAFLYVAPAVRYVLGYDPDELVGRSLTDFCHPADRVPLTRELKDASAGPGSSLLTATQAASSSSSPASAQPSAADGSLSSSSSGAPRPVNLLFRMQAKGRGYVWIECRGRLHVEPGKGRKAIILSGRVRNMPHIEWGPISRAGGLVAPVYHAMPPSSASVARGAGEDDRPPKKEREFWALLSANAAFLYVGTAVRDVLGWGPGEVMGKPLAEFVSGSSPQDVHMAIDVEMTKVLADAGGAESSGLMCDMRTKDGATVFVHVFFYRSRPLPKAGGVESVGNGGDPAAQPPVACQVKLCDGTAPPPASAIVHPLGESVFDETEIGRGSSWQYELQQLKFKNLRLEEEVAELEKTCSKKVRRKQTLSTSTTTVSVPGAISTGGGRSLHAAARMNVSYAPQLPSPVPMQPPPPFSAPLNVRFVADNQGMPRVAPQASQPSRQVPPSSSSQAVHRPQPTLPPTLPTPSAQQPQGQLPAIPAAHPHVYDQQPPPPGALGEPASFSAPSRVRQSSESSLHGWSYDLSEPDGGAPTNVYSNARVTAYNGLPLKRAWDSSPRDPGGGGA